MKAENKLWPLEVCRGVAAIYVVLHHSRQMLPHAIQPLLLFGQEAVILFFLLSGFVIHYNYSVKKGFDRADFLWKRFVRIYPIFILVMLLSVVLNIATGAQQAHMDVATFFYNIVGLQDSQLQKPGIGYATFGDNDPLWSLGYEAWFYLFYAIAGSKNFNRNLVIVTVIALAAGILFSFYPGKAYLTLFYLPIWWLGAAIAQSTITERIRPFAWGMLVLLIALGGYVAGSYQQISSSNNSIGLHPFIEIRHFTAAIVFAILWMAAQKWLSLKHFAWMEPLAILAPVSYGIYIVHVPLLRGVKFVLHDGLLSWLVFVVLTLLMAYLLEIQFQKKIVLPLLLKRKKTPALVRERELVNIKA
ncbi:Peptidoglycan/LPS O-acetylase OafA/YrhL, contains acyltransferase and SGNH-hydrolase domains [Chitinophaga sp. CF118]|uniref:acyltransferase family protein n=1 Tax=Chitinophaga sp. CF118 TaxID=1884367 RepID=UPI0008F3BAB9|nr:acyltransferase [Chitinophaga sp. CF118]SFE02828.1 Peptidoglycan/LPS O-acetylase OafA/YrhL, contains acyltransferase and SGNH-hydrolase domains [Chitinophaga sp. CF118]